MISPIALTVASEFFNELLFGNGAWLYLFIVLAIAFLVSYRVFWFAIVSMIGTLFMGLQYISYAQTNGWTNDLIYKVILLFFCASLFLYIFAQEAKK